MILSSIRPLIHPGRNKIEFTVSSLLQGPKKLETELYLWNENVKIVISDVDGTITSSDVLGQVLPNLGKDWTHPGIAKLYKIISEKENVVFIYMSSRPIAEAGLTRKYIRGIEQDGLKLPDSPLITCPDKLIPALTREVVKRQPHLFKIPKLVLNLFNGFYPHIWKPH